MSGDVYSRDDVWSAAYEFFCRDPFAADAYTNKYAMRDNTGSFLEPSPAHSCMRMAKEFARIEARYPEPMSLAEIYGLLVDIKGSSVVDERGLLAAACGLGRVIPQGGPWSALGNPHQVQSLSNCFVIESPHDSYGGVMKTDQELAQIMKRRGGVGVDISTLRPRGMVTKNAALTTDGIGVFMERFSRTCEEVAQGGRRGAEMQTISVMHPEIETFINIKRTPNKVTGANVSVKLTDEFMRAVRDDLDVDLRWPVDVPVEDAKVHVKRNAREIWAQIVDAAWAAGEPGILFWDTVRKMSPADAYKQYQSVSVNPCGEILLAPGSACRLMVVNVTKFVHSPFTQDTSFDDEAFGLTVAKAERLMDDLVDLEIEAIDRIIAKIDADDEPESVKMVEREFWQLARCDAHDARRTGLGITGLGDAIAMLGMRYGSQESIKFVESTYRKLAISAWKSSCTLAKQRGAFPAYDARVEDGHAHITKLLAVDAELAAMHAAHGRRNIALTTTAPVGTISTLTRTTSGIEPAYEVKYRRMRKLTSSEDVVPDRVDERGVAWKAYDIEHHGFAQWMQVTGKDDVTQSPYSGSTAHDIDWVASVELQAAAQKWVDHSISKTHNLPKAATREDVERVYMRSWELGCKGATVYRDGCREGVLLSAADDVKQPELITETHAPKRPRSLPCDIHRTTVKGSQYAVIVGLLDGHPYELFAGVSACIDVPKRAKRGELIKNGKGPDGQTTYNLRIPIGDDDELVLKDITTLFDNALYGTHTRMVSLALRHGVPLEYLCEQLRRDKTSDITSFSSVIARVLSKNYLSENAPVKGHVCAACGSAELAYVEGCVTCVLCSWSKCS